MLNFKSKYPIGIDISSQNIYAVQLKKTRQGFAVRALAHGELETEIASIPDANPGIVYAVKKMTKSRNFRGKSALRSVGKALGANESTLSQVSKILGTVMYRRKPLKEALENFQNKQKKMGKSCNSI